MLGFVAQEPVRTRFGFDEDDLATMAEWIGETNVRWGLDGEHRTRFGIPESLVTNTWQAALDRLLIGSSTIDDELVLAIGDTAPYGVEGSDVDILGHLAEVLSHLGTLALETTTSAPLGRLGRARSGRGRCALRHPARFAVAAGGSGPVVVVHGGGGVDRRRSLPGAPPLRRCQAPVRRAPDFRGGATGLLPWRHNRHVDDPAPRGSVPGGVPARHGPVGVRLARRGQ